MEITKEKIGDVLQVSFSGRLVAACSEEFKRVMFAAIADEPNVVMNLSGMEHVDSSGIGVLVHILQKKTDDGGFFKLACLQPKPKIVFDITKVYRIFEIYDTVEAAVESFKK